MKIKIHPISVDEPAIVKHIDLFRAKAGFPSPAMDYIENEMDLNALLIKHPSSTFMIEAEGDSMVNIIPDGAKLLVDRSLQVRQNDIVLAIINGEFFVKYYNRRGDTISLVAGNPKYAPVKIVDGMEFSIFGVVAHVLIDTRKVNNVRPR